MGAGGDDSILRNLFGSGGEASDSQLGKNKRILYKGVVRYVCMLNAGIEWTTTPGLSSLVSGKTIELIEDAPRNSCLVQLISDGLGKTTAPVLCYPFFPPHLCFPIKSGEQVWIINEIAGTVDSIPHWICRIPEAMRVDDINYTHGDRKWHEVIRDIEQLDELFKDPENLDTGIELPGFPNGGNTRKTFTLKQPVGTENAYNAITKVAQSMASFRYEPVPRFTKRPGDTVIQGSNNTLIWLGEDRGWKDFEIPRLGVTNAYQFIGNEIATGQGTIDMVTGRGRHPTQYTIDKAFGSCPTTTSPRTIMNQRGMIETDKYPSANGYDQMGTRNNNPPGRVSPDIEGDPDFVHDAARIYITSNTQGDINFGITQTIMVPITTPDSEEPMSWEPKTFEGTRMASSMAPDYRFVDEGNQSFIIQKADHLRLIARRLKSSEAAGGAAPPNALPRSEHGPGTETLQDTDINGSIRIIKEGDKNTDLALIALRPDGTIQVSGSKIYIGRAPRDGGFEGVDGNDVPITGQHNTGPGDESLLDAEVPEDPGVSQPWVKYQQLEDLLNTLFDNVESFCTTLATHTTPGYGAPSIQIKTAADTLKKDVGKRRDEIVRMKSKRIFGE